MLSHRHVPALLAAFGLGADGRLSDAPVASGRVGSIWRLDTDGGSWAVKEVRAARGRELREVTEGAAFQEAALAAGVPVPAVRRTNGGALIADLGGARARVVEWVDLRSPDIRLDPGDVGRLVARLHLVDFTGSVGLDAWYDGPVGVRRWRGLVGRLGTAGAPFAAELSDLLPEMLSLEAILGAPPRALRTCHRDLWADNVRRTGQGGLCVFDFDEAGLADPSRELAAMLVEYAGSDAARAGQLRDAYGAAGGPGRVEELRDFSMVIAQLFHIVAEGCRRWLASTTDEQRADNEGWVREYLDRPLTRSLLESLLA
jgi:Ser/Thr protein kinase RdoA (MazF antagonist)